MTMEKHVQTLLNKPSITSTTVATLILITLYLQTPQTCISPSHSSVSKPETRFPKSTCDFTHRTFSSPETRNRRIWSTNAWSITVSSYAAIFKSHYYNISNHSRVLIVSAGPGQAVAALKKMGVDDVTGVEIVESPPLVARADLFNLPFFDGVFDFSFGVYLDRALFPARYVGELERMVRGGGVCVVGVEECRVGEVEMIVKLFRKSRFVDRRNVFLGGERRTVVVMRRM